MSYATRLVLLLSAAVPCVVANSNGAPLSSCSSMSPNHFVPAQDGPSPYTIELSSQTFCPNMPVTVTIQGSENFKGFLCQPRKVVDTYETSGQLESADKWSVKNNCDKTALTHSNNDVKRSLQMTWTPYATDTETVYIVCTIVKEKEKFWEKQKSEAITYAGSDVCDDQGQSNPCSLGSPLSEPANCGRGGERCPENHYCEIAPNDAYAVCCQKACSTDADCTMVTNSSCMSGKCQVDRQSNPCSLGSPSSEPANCGRGGEQCPENHYCEIAPNDAYAVCCQKACSTDADCTMVTNSSCMSGKCQVDRQSNPCSLGSPSSEPANCGRGGKQCPENHYCEIAPNDAYAVCCQKACSTDADCTMVTNSSCMSGKCQVDQMAVTCSSDLECSGMSGTTCIAGKCTVSGAKEAAVFSVTLLLGVALFLWKLL